MRDQQPFIAIYSTNYNHLQLLHSSSNFLLVVTIVTVVNNVMDLLPFSADSNLEFHFNY